MKKHYRSKDGRHLFAFDFAPSGEFVEVFCRKRPPLNGKDPSDRKTHIFSSGKICFVSERRPKTMNRAEELAAQWAEYYLEYCRTGIAQG
jgi:hypothetical protein